MFKYVSNHFPTSFFADHPYHRYFQIRALGPTFLKGPAAESCSKNHELRRTRAIQMLRKNIKTPRNRARLTIVKLLVPPVILRPTLQGSDTSKSSNAQPLSREVTFFNDFVVFHWFWSNLQYITCIYYTDLHSKFE